MEYIAGHPDRPVKAKGLANALDIGHEDYPEFREFVREMLRDGSLTLGPGRRLALPERTGTIVGVYQAHPRGFGFINRSEDIDVYVPRGRAPSFRANVCPQV